MSMQISISNAIGGGGGAQRSESSFQNEYSFNFDGVDDYIESASVWSVLDNATSWSISFWIYPTIATTKYVMQLPNTTQLTFLYRGASTSELVDLSISSTSYFARSSVGSVPPNQWTHVVWTWDGSQSRYNKYKLYINGVSDLATQAGSLVTQMGTSTNLKVGRFGTNTAFLGNLDEIAFWNGTIISEAEASEIYNSGVPTNLNDFSTPPNSWIRMGENATWDREWTITDEISSDTYLSFNMAEADRETNVPTFVFNRKSIELDGVDDIVSMGNVLDMANDGTDAFSISCWFKTTDTGLQMLVAKQLNTSPYNGYNLYFDANRIKFSFGQVFSDHINGQTGLIGTITDGNWHHLALTYDGSQDISGFNLYYDNSNITILTIANNTPNNVSNSADFMIGARGTTSSYNLQFSGNIDEVAYFNSELSASDVSTIYGTGAPSDLSSLSPVSWWRCGDGDTSPTLTDNGSGGNDGTMTNFSTFSSDVPT